jgi:hypothetical protein
MRDNLSMTAMHEGHGFWDATGFLPLTEFWKAQTGYCFFQDNIRSVMT